MSQLTAPQRPSSYCSSPATFFAFSTIARRISCTAELNVIWLLAGTFDVMRLGPEQQQLLFDLVEAERRVRPEERTKFIVVYSVGPPGVRLIHPGWLDRARRVFEGDLEALAAEGCLYRSSSSKGSPLYHISPAGFEHYQTLKADGDAVQHQEETVRRYLASDHFQSRHPAAFQKWNEAEALLWGDDSQRSLTLIGHLCREALQEFAAALKAAPVEGASAAPAMTVTRIRAAIASKRPALGPKHAALLDALLSYWGTVSDLAQRQEHGGLKEGESLVFVDGQRLVLHTMIVMYELDSALH